jgi:hypothetical protein
MSFANVEIFEQNLIALIDKAVNKDKVPIASVFGILSLQTSSTEAQVLDRMFNQRLQQQLIANAKLKTDEIKSEIVQNLDIINNSRNQGPAGER